MSSIYINERYLFLDNISTVTQTITMGNCCGTKSLDSPVETPPTTNLPRVISVSKAPTLICLDASPTPDSAKLKASLKGTFGGVVLINSERRLLYLIETRDIGNYCIVIVGRFEEETMNFLVNSSKVKSIYLCLGEPELDEIPHSKKIKGFFEEQMELKRAIGHDLYGN